MVFYTESKDTTCRDRENEDEEQNGNPHQEEPCQGREQSAATRKVRDVERMSLLVIIPCNLAEFYKNTFHKEDNADQTGLINTIDVNNKKENDFPKNSDKGNEQGGHNQESEKKNPVHMPQGIITMVTDQSGVSECSRSSDHNREPLICQGGSQEVIDSSRTCCQDRPLSGGDHIEDKATQTPRDDTWVVEGVNQERDCVLNSNTEKQSDPTPDSHLESIPLEKQTQSTTFQKVPSGSRSDGITGLKDDESLCTPSEIANIQDVMNVDTESPKEESKVSTESVVDSIIEVMGSRETRKKVDITTKTSILPENKFRKNGGKICADETGFMDEIGFDDHNSTVKSFVAVDDSYEGKGMSVHFAEDRLKQLKEGCQDTTGGEEKMSSFSPTPGADSKKVAAEMSKNGGDEEAIVSDLLDAGQVVNAEEKPGAVKSSSIQKEMDSTDKSQSSCNYEDELYKKDSLSEKRKSTSADEETDEDSWIMMMKHQVEDSQDRCYKKDNSYADSKGPSREEEEDDWKVTGKNQMLTEAQGDVNKKEKLCLSGWKRSFSPNDGKCDEGNREMVGKNQLTQSEGNLCKVDNSFPSDKKSSKYLSGEEDKDDWEVLDQMLTEAQGDVLYKKERSCQSNGKRNSSTHDEKSGEDNCKVTEKIWAEGSEDDLCKKDNSCPCDKNSSGNPSGEKDEDDWEMIDRGRLWDVKKKEKSLLSEKKKSSNPHNAKSVEDSCKMLEKDQPALPEDEGDWEMIDRGQLCEVNKKDKSLLSEKEKSSNPHNAKSDEDNCKMMEKDQPALSEDEDDCEMIDRGQLCEVNKKDKSLLSEKEKSSNPHDAKSDEDNCKMMEKDQPALSEDEDDYEMIDRGRLCEVNKKDKSLLSEKKKSSDPHDAKPDEDNCKMVGKDQPALSKDEDNCEMIDRGQLCEVNKKDKSLLSEKEKSSNPHNAKSDEDNCKMVEKDQPALSEDEDDCEMIDRGRLCEVNKKDKSLLSEKKKSSNPQNAKSDEDNCKMVGKDQPALSEDEDGCEMIDRGQLCEVNKKDKSLLSEKEKSSNPHNAKSDEDNCKTVEKDQPALSEDEDDYEMIDRGWLCEVNKKDKSRLSEKEKSSNPHNAKPDEDDCKMMEKDQPALSEDEDDYEMIDRGRLCEVNKKDKSLLSEKEKSSNPHNAKSDKDNCKMVEKDQPALSEDEDDCKMIDRGRLCEVNKKDKSLLSEKEKSSNPHNAKSDEDNCKMVGKDQPALSEDEDGCEMIDRGQLCEVNKKDKSRLSEKEKSSNPHNAKSDEDNCKMVEKDQPALSEDEDDYEMIDRGWLCEVNKKDKSLLSEKEKSSNPHNAKPDEDDCKMMEKDQPALSEDEDDYEMIDRGRLCEVNKKDKSLLSEKEKSSNPHNAKPAEDDCKMMEEDQPALSEDEDDYEMIDGVRLCEVNKKDKSLLSEKEKSSNPHNAKSDEDNCKMVEKDQPALSEDEDDFEMIDRGWLCEVNKKDKSLLSEKKKSSNPHNAKSDEDYCKMVGKDQPALSEDADGCKMIDRGQLCEVNKKDKSLLSEKEKSSNPHNAKPDEDDCKMMEKDQPALSEDEDDYEMIDRGRLCEVNKKDKSLLSEKEKSSNPHNAKPDEDDCKMMEKDQPALSEDADGCKMIDRGQLCEVNKKDKSLLSEKEKSSNPHNAKPDEDDCKIMEKDQQALPEDEGDWEMIDEEQLCEVNKKDKSLLSEKEKSSDPHDAKSDEGKMVGKDQPEDLSKDEDDWVRSEKGWQTDIQENVYNKGKSSLSGGKRSCSPPHGETDEDRWETKEKDQLDESQGGFYKEDNSGLSEKGGNYCPLYESDNFVEEKITDGFPEYSEFGQNSMADEIFSEVSQGHQGNDLKVPPPPLKDEVDHHCGKDGNVLMRRKCEKQDPFEAGTSGAQPKERFTHPPGKIPLQCSEYCAQNYWQQIILQEGEIGRPCSEPSVSDYWLQMVIQDVPPECGCSESRTEGGRLLAFCTEDP